jgi:glucose 1-dehydrogenase
MTQKSVVITGAARGIGAATSEAFARAGWTVIAVDLRESRTPSAGSHHLSIQADIGETSEVQRVVEIICSHSQKIGSLVNNAAVQVTETLAGTSPDDWDRVMRVNVRAAFQLAKGLAKPLEDGEGAIVNVASVHAVATSSAISAYAASKGALVSLTRALALELAPKGVRANAVLPGAIDTGMLRAGLERDQFDQGADGDMLDRLASRTPLRRVGRPQEVAEAILFLSDNDRSSFITGQTLVVDGGALAALSTEATE